MKDANYWKNRIKEHQEQRKKTLNIQMDIKKAMEEYLKTVGETEDFTLNYEDYGAVNITCNGDLFNLEQIGGFCDVFGLTLLINNRLVVEHYILDETSVKTRYLFNTGEVKFERMEDGIEMCNDLTNAEDMRK